MQYALQTILILYMQYALYNMHCNMQYNVQFIHNMIHYAVSHRTANQWTTLHHTCIVQHNDDVQLTHCGTLLYVMKITVKVKVLSRHMCSTYEMDYSLAMQWCILEDFCPTSGVILLSFGSLTLVQKVSKAEWNIWYSIRKSRHCHWPSECLQDSMVYSTKCWTGPGLKCPISQEVLWLKAHLDTIQTHFQLA